MVFQLDDHYLWFPDPYLGEEDGLIAVGGDLSIDRLLLAYSHGIFPWYAFRENPERLWFCPLKRFVIFPDEIHVSHSMRTLMNKGRYRVSVNEDFEGVIRHCSELRIHEQGAWLGEEMIEAYLRLFEQGFAASVEVWEEEKLVGGLYGVTIGSGFFGESMFSLVPSASKLALIVLAKTMQEVGGKIIDCQFETAHLKSMGGRYITYEEYMGILQSEEVNTI
jgi:leucyl/phenylalanyl-tRNA--protein transferase